MGARQIGFVSVGRSDWGHLQPLLKLLPEAIVYKWATTAVNEPVEVAIQSGLAVGNFAHQFCYQKPDLLCVFGDRWEQLAAATAAHLMNIPICHLHAGETTEAVIDDACRAAISAMATLHVTAAEPYAERLKRQGYQRVYNLGAPGLARIGPRVFKPDPRIILVAFHPETKGGADVGAQARELAKALRCQADQGALIYVTEPGMDAGRNQIIEALSPFGFQHVTDEEWVTLLRAASVIVGNSSCGIIEAPTVPLPTVNIGNRQAGRLMASSVVTVPAEGRTIHEAIEVVCHPAWQKTKLTGENPYGDRHAAERIAELLTTCPI